MFENSWDIRENRNIRQIQLIEGELKIDKGTSTREEKRVKRA